MHPRVRDLLAHPERDPATAAEIRRRITRSDPLRFALLYLTHHMRTNGQITLSEFHRDLAEKAKAWMEPPTEPGTERDVFVAPRDAAKSTWLFTFLPLWAAAHGHLRFIAAFADSSTQAELHLATFRHELETNEKLRTDYPDLCKPLVRGRGATSADRQDMYQAQNGFVFAARGVDSRVLGLKVGHMRPDLLLLDDVEPDEARYSEAGIAKRRKTITDAILPMNIYARVVLVGTVVRVGSIIHQLVRHHENPQQWITDEGFRVHHYLPILTNPDGSERSLWPAKWPLDWLKSRQHTTSYAKNFLNKPRSSDGTWWDDGDIQIVTGLVTQRTILSIDPAVTSKDSSDFTGFAVVSRSGKRTVVHYARGVKVAHGEPMRRLILRILEEFPQISVIRVEDNQGKDLWKLALRDLPVRVVLRHTSRSKEVRFAGLLNRYQLGRCVHDRHIPDAEEQMYAYPAVTNDDVIDAIALADAALSTTKKKAGAQSVDYAGSR
jgi:phage terminase large subunit-like protein